MNFVRRHVGPNLQDQQMMLKDLGLNSLNQLIEETVPKAILHRPKVDLPAALSESEFLGYARTVANKNRVFKSFIGMGYYDCHTPPVILRNVLENPGWYTAYTPYQAEISQGRMEALLNFQTMIMEMTSMPIANASLLDEGTAAAEAMVLCHAATKKKNADVLFVDENVFPQTLEVLRTRAEPLGIKLEVGTLSAAHFTEQTFALLLQYPGANGAVTDPTPILKKAQAAGVLSIVATDLLSLCLLKAPGEMGADVVVGSSQRFGVPMGFGGPHAAFLATKEEFKRLMPGRIIGVSKDSEGHPALRLALQTREQHIRREKATSNICTAQVLLAVMASMYAIYHGPEGLRQIAARVNNLARLFATGLKRLGLRLVSENFFDTVQVQMPKAMADSLQAKTWAREMNVGRPSPEVISVAWDETKTEADLEDLLQLFSQVVSGSIKANQNLSLDSLSARDATWDSTLDRQSPCLTAAVFNLYHSETEMLRYIHRLEMKDLALNQAMIPLGSCTMKLNATAEMIPVTWPEIGQIHPFAPLEQAQGYLELISQLEHWLCELTGFSAVSLQPNAGSQGEYAGLLVIRRYLENKGQTGRNVCLIPSSAHGTNPASAVMAGFKVVVVQCDDLGNIDLTDLKAKAGQNRDQLGALMVTYPSTHGVFEESITEICKIVHEHGGQVYMDGANLNAMVGLCQPARFGADVSHMNLHKTFCIPHGGGGPGVGPIGVAEHLAPFLPKHSLVPACGPSEGISAVSAAPWGSASILPISWAYIAMMGADGLKTASEVAILNANYIAKKLEPHFPTLYANHNGRVAHECILDLRPLKNSSGIGVDDVAKRLMDYGFHAPTMSWPVPGTLMVEPTESESKAE
ncbi:MAG: aminomethyl-transferring glycine dehydrogenase, partial [Bdellovibrionales bacterium]